MIIDFIKQNKRKLIIGSGVAVFLIIILYILSVDAPPEDLEVFTFTPFDGADEVSINTSIDVVFVDTVAEDVQEKISVDISPEINYQEEWLTGKQLRINPLTDLSYGTSYGITVLYNNNEISSGSFTTEKGAPQQEDLELPEISDELQEDLLEDATVMQESVNELVEEMPWYFDLPITTDDYVVVYNPERGQFRISLYVPENTPQNEIDALVNSAINDLKNIGVNMEEYDYYTIFR